MNRIPDVIIVGSGPSGAMAASTLVRSGLLIQMIDAGKVDEEFKKNFPLLPFSEIREKDDFQSRYLIGDRLEGVPLGKKMVGAQLTPPRQYVLHSNDSPLSKIETPDTVDARQSLAKGGLGAAWGTSCFTYSAEELSEIGLDPTDFPRLYEEVAREIGVSGPTHDDCSDFFFSGAQTRQPPVTADRNAQSTLDLYQNKKSELNARGLFLGRSFLALLTEPLGDRQATTYLDMDFYHDLGQSAYRPRYTIEALEKFPNFIYTPGLLVTQLIETDHEGVEVQCMDIISQEQRSFKAKRALLCAGTLNSARLALHSLGRYDESVPFLYSPATFVPCVNFQMLGKAADAHRLSLAQISGIFTPPDDPRDLISYQINHYSSLLLFKLVKEMPLPPWAGLLVARLLVNGISIVSMYHSDRPSARNWIKIKANKTPYPTLVAQYDPDPLLLKKRMAREKLLKKCLLKLRYLPFSNIRPKWGTTMHYAGSIPMSPGGSTGKLETLKDYRLGGTRNIFVGDSSSWNFLPAKGLTFTIMANAKKAAEHLLASLRER